MQMSFFSIPARGDSGLQEDLNRFLRSHRVLTVHRDFVPLGENSFWAPFSISGGRRSIPVPHWLFGAEQPTESPDGHLFQVAC
jgi:hypothetical protein